MSRTVLMVALAMSVIATSPFALMADEVSQSVREQLQSFLDGKLPAKQLTITYSDLHGLYGGLKLTIHGTGDVVQKAVRLEVPDARPLTQEQVRELIKLLIKEQAWRQSTPPAIAVPDESRATLTIVAGDAKSSIWERTREMKMNDRIIRVRELMQESAWPRSKE